MDPDPSNISKIIKSLKKRGFEKEANVLEDLFLEPVSKTVLVSDCPICGNEPEPSCVLCDGTGELSSIVPDDDEDVRVEKELKINQASVAYENLDWFQKGVYLSREDIEKNQWGDLPAAINALYDKPKSLDEAKNFIEGYLSVGPADYVDFERDRVYGWLNRSK